MKEWNELGGTHFWVADGGYCKADYLVLYQISQRMGTVGEDIKNRHIEQEARKARMKRGKH